MCFGKAKKIQTACCSTLPWLKNRQNTPLIKILANTFSDENDELFFALNTYHNSVKKISRETLKALENNDLSLLEKDIAQDILRNSPENIKQVEVKLKPSIQSCLSHFYYYTHSLCSHVGNCQRFHGHGSLIEVYKNKKLDEQKSKNLAQFLNNKYIVAQNYLQKNWESPLIQEIVQYCPEIENLKANLLALEYTGTQGKIGLILSKQKVVTLDFESTVENIASYAGKQFENESDIQIIAYEGLCKGAIYP